MNMPWSRLLMVKRIHPWQHDRAEVFQLYAEDRGARTTLGLRAGWVTSPVVTKKAQQDDDESREYCQYSRGRQENAIAPHTHAFPRNPWNPRSDPAEYGRLSK